MQRREVAVTRVLLENERLAIERVIERALLRLDCGTRPLKVAQLLAEEAAGVTTFDWQARRRTLAGRLFSERPRLGAAA